MTSPVCYLAQTAMGLDSLYPRLSDFVQINDTGTQYLAEQFNVYRTTG